MVFGKYLSSLHGARIITACFGGVVGTAFLLYSLLVFGSRAFTPSNTIVCLAVGGAAGLACYYMIRQALKLYLERQWLLFCRVTGENPESNQEGMNQLLHRDDLLVNGLMKILEGFSTLTADLSSQHDRLKSEFTRAMAVKDKQKDKETETTKAVDDMNEFFNHLLQGIEDITARTEERASIATEMSATTDAIARNIKDYSSSVMETSASIEEMAMSIRETTGNIEGLAASTEETFNSISLIGNSIANVRDNARRTSDCSEKVRLQAHEGMEAMSATIAAMLDIEKNSNHSVEAIQRLTHHSLQVGEFLKIIKDVVAQTNLLSLNASIIAAQAGEQGKSFAVVAAEVRALAQRTSASTSQIEDLVRNIQEETAAAEKAVSLGKEKVAEGVRISERADETLHRIEESAAEACLMVQKIAAATDEQAVQSQKISGEAEKNLTRVKQFSMAIKEEERGAGLIVKALEHMGGLSQKITTSTDEQARGNRLYMRSVLEDNDRVKQLRETCIQQIMMGDVLRNDVAEIGRLLHAGTGETGRILTEMENTGALIAALRQKLLDLQAVQETFFTASPVAAP